MKSRSRDFWGGSDGYCERSIVFTVLIEGSKLRVSVQDDIRRKDRIRPMHLNKLIVHLFIFFLFA